MEAPQDFVRPNHIRPSAWFRTGVIDEAVVFQTRLNAADLWALADWCVKAAKFIDAMTGNGPAEEVKPKGKKSA